MGLSLQYNSRIGVLLHSYLPSFDHKRGIRGRVSEYESHINREIKSWILAFARMTILLFN